MIDRLQGTIGVNLEAYVDDIVIKSKTKDALFCVIIEMFQNLRRINMKLNPAKCTFWVEEGKFLGHIIDASGIWANSKKIQHVLVLTPHKNLTELQSPNEKLAALS